MLPLPVDPRGGAGPPEPPGVGGPVPPPFSSPPSPPRAEPAPLRWPLDLKPAALTSTFGETRGSSFHAGVDLKTWGRTGYPVHAVADGWVQRLRTSPWGYGRALYQRLDDGRLVVYAHLERFFEPASKRIRAEQRRTRQYTVDLWLKEGRSRSAVARGSPGPDRAGPAPRTCTWSSATPATPR